MNQQQNAKVGSVRELNVYKIAFDTAMKIYEISKDFPKEEKYSLTDQIRRSSRSVCTNLAEGWRKRRYRAVFITDIFIAKGNCGSQPHLSFKTSRGRWDSPHFL